jgi:glycine cleavage system H lipoate-binding protein
MNCPFLKEARVKYCEKSAFRRMIRIAGDIGQGTCSTPRYQGCAVYQRHANTSQDAQCPYLRESLAQYCATTAVPRFIPYRAPGLSRCASDSYRYCDFYLAAEPAAMNGEKREYETDGIRMPNWLHYTANHMWLDEGQGGACHIGVDAFLARVLGSVERITFLRRTGVQSPSAVLTVGGIDLEVTFPNPILVTASNLYLRGNPAKITADTYGGGWLFEGMQLAGEAPVTAGLIRGEAIMPWIDGEIDRMSAFLSECWGSRHNARLMNDGGVFSPNVLEHLDREETLRLFHEFFWSAR